MTMLATTTMVAGGPPEKAKHISAHMEDYMGVGNVSHRGVGQGQQRE